MTLSLSHILGDIQMRVMGKELKYYLFNGTSRKNSIKIIQIEIIFKNIFKFSNHF